VAELTPQQLADLIRKLDDVCQQAHDLSKQLRAQMAARARADQQMISSGTPERRHTPRNRRAAERRTPKRS